MEIPAKTYNEKFESFLKILESDDRFDNVCKNFLESICSALYVNAATVTVSGYENSEPLSYELIPIILPVWKNQRRKTKHPSRSRNRFPRGPYNKKDAAEHGMALLRFACVPGEKMV